MIEKMFPLQDLEKLAAEAWAWSTAETPNSNAPPLSNSAAGAEPR
jgi:hypothetical protein